MASRAYVASMTVAELTTELKQRGLSTKGRKKTLMERLEKAFDEEELNDPSSDEDSGSQKDGQGARAVSGATAQNDETRRDSEPMIVAIELGNRDNLEVRTNEVLKKNDEQMIVAIHLNNPQELRVKEDDEAKQDEPNSLGAWSQEQPSDSAVAQPPSGLLCLTKCAKDTTANVCEAEPSGQLASKGQETERVEDDAEQAPTVSNSRLVPPTEGGHDQCAVALVEGSDANLPSKQSPVKALSPDGPPGCSLPATTGLPTEWAPPHHTPSVTATSPSAPMDTLPCTSALPPPQNAPEATTGRDQPQVPEALATARDKHEQQGTSAHQLADEGLPHLVADTAPPHTSCKDTSGVLKGVGREVGHEEVSQGGTEGQIDVDVVVYAEEDEFSMFSTEADELQKFSARGKNSVPAASSRSSSHDQVASSRDRKNGESAQPDIVTELVQVRKRDAVVEQKSDQSAVKKRRISAPTTPGADKGEPHERKRRWGSGNKHKGPGGLAAVTTDISSDLLQEIIPAGIETREPSALEAVMSYGEDDCAEDNLETKDKVVGTKDAVGGDQRSDKQREREGLQKDQERANQELETRRRIESRLKVKKEVGNAPTNAVGSHPPSPPKNPPSHILHVENLTRPFTLVQLKELLTEDGPMVKDGFWTNKVKSHCIIVYETDAVAVATRKRLHGMKWPSTNPKLLTADFLTIDEVTTVSGGDLIIKEDGEKGRDSVMEEDHTTAPEAKTTVLDSSTIDGSSGSAAVSSLTKPEESEKVEKSEEKGINASSPTTEKAAKTLDTLFRRTIAAPSIYWLPLTEAQANEKVTIEAAKDAERQKRREEREKELCAIREKEEQERKERDQKMREEREKEHKLREERKLKDEKEKRDQDKRRDRSRERHRRRSRSTSRGPRSRSRDRRR